MYIYIYIYMFINICMIIYKYIINTVCVFPLYDMYIYFYICTVCIRDRVALRCQTSTSHLRYPLVFAAAVCFEDGEVAVASVPLSYKFCHQRKDST